MGLSIHYSGKIKSYALIEALITEVEDICKSMNWEYHVYDTDKSTLKPGEKADVYTPEDLKGISFAPEGCESIFLTFLPNATICSFLKLIYYDPATNDLMIEVVHTKTQYAGPDVHIAVLKLLHYLKEKYFETFWLSDEGDYWEKWDEQILLDQFDRYNFIVNTMREALADIKLVPGETVESLADRIEDILKKRFDADGNSSLGDS